MRIPIKELEQIGYTEESLLESLIVLSRFIVKKAREIYPSQAIDDIEGYFLLFCDKILVQARTTCEVIIKHQDYTTVCALVRLLADNICIVKLIYDERNPQERELRHYLYLYDGLMLRKRELEKPYKPYDKSIPFDSYNRLEQQIHDSLDNTNKAIAVCLTQMRTNKLYDKYGAEIEYLIQKRNWQYDTICSGVTKISKLNWTELNKKLGVLEYGIYAYMSQYIHGLSVSNMSIDAEEDFTAPCNFAVSLVGTLFHILQERFSEELLSISPEELMELLSYCPDNYRCALFEKMGIRI